MRVIFFHYWKQCLNHGNASDGHYIYSFWDVYETWAVFWFHSIGILGRTTLMLFIVLWLPLHVAWYHTRNKNVTVVGLATQTSKKHTNKCVDGSNRFWIKVTQTSAQPCHLEFCSVLSHPYMHLFMCFLLVWVANPTIIILLFLVASIFA